jgi:hypothetical protein
MILWKHVKSGERYCILSFAVNERDCSPVVVYQNETGKGPVWVRPCAEFFDGRFRQVDMFADEVEVEDLNPELVRVDTETHGVIRVAEWPEGRCLWIGGEIVWKEWQKRKTKYPPIGDKVDLGLLLWSSEEGDPDRRLKLYRSVDDTIYLVRRGYQLHRQVPPIEGEADDTL